MVTVAVCGMAGRVECEAWLVHSQLNVSLKLALASPRKSASAVTVELTLYVSSVAEPVVSVELAEILNEEEGTGSFAAYGGSYGNVVFSRTKRCGSNPDPPEASGSRAKILVYSCWVIPAPWRAEATPAGIGSWPLSHP